jgi:hypothetical protein
MKINPQQTQTAFSVIQQLGMLLATPNVSEDNMKEANATIYQLLSKIIKPAVQDLTAEASGLIVK